MQVSRGARLRSGTTPTSEVVSSAEHHTLKTPLEASPDSNLVYNLRNGSSDSDAFYSETAKFAERSSRRLTTMPGRSWMDIVTTCAPTRESHHVAVVNT